MILIIGNYVRSSTGEKMSSSENNCIETACYNCMEPICTSCSDQCSENCQTNCQNACSDACSNACSQACSNITCRCGGSETTSMLLGAIFNAIFPLIGGLLLGLIQAFDPSGPLVLTVIGSGILTISLTGVNLMNFQTRSRCNFQSDKQYSTRIGFIIVNHSHHPLEKIREGHEFKLKDKYFCTGCYGLLSGTLLAIALSVLYLVYGVPSQIIPPIALLVPICFVPIILRYKFVNQPSFFLRFVSNGLLPLGCCLMLLIMDAIFHSWSINLTVIVLIVLTAYFRGMIAKRDNQI